MAKDHQSSRWQKIGGYLWGKESEERGGRGFFLTSIFFCTRSISFHNAHDMFMIMMKQLLLPYLQMMIIMIESEGARVEIDFRNQKIVSGIPPYPLPYPTRFRVRPCKQKRVYSSMGSISIRTTSYSNSQYRGKGWESTPPATTSYLS